MAREDTKIEALYQADGEMIASLEGIKAWITEATNQLNSNSDKEQYSRQLDILKTISRFIDQTTAESTYSSIEKSNIARKMDHLVHSERTRIDIGNAIRLLILATLIPVILVIESFRPNQRLTLPLMIRDLVDPKLRVINSGYSLEKQFSEDNAMSDLKKLKRYAEKIAKARNDDERYQPLKDIMDAMIIMLAKASSMFMPPAVIDITIKALGIIGGHLADIIREDFEKIANKPNNSVKLADLTEKKQELEKTIHNSIKAAESSQRILSFYLTDTAKKLGLPVDNQKQISEEFINTFEEKIKNIQLESKENKTLNLKSEELKSLREQATEKIKLYRKAQTTFESMKKRKEELKTLDQPGEQNIKKGTDRKSIKDMRSELQNKRDLTYKEKVLGRNKNIKTSLRLGKY